MILKKYVFFLNLKYMLFFLSIISILLSTILACSPSTHSSKKENILERVRLYWDKRIAGDYDVMYTLEAEMNKRKIKKSEYRKIFGDQAQIISYNIQDVKIISEKNKATVSVIYEIELKIPVPGLLGYRRKLVAEDFWILENANWFHVQ